MLQQTQATRVTPQQPTYNRDQLRPIKQRDGGDGAELDHDAVSVRGQFYRQRNAGGMFGRRRAVPKRLSFVIDERTFAFEPEKMRRDDQVASRRDG